VEDSSWIKERLLIFLWKKSLNIFSFVFFLEISQSIFFEKFFEKKTQEHDKNFHQWSKVLVQLVRVKIRKYSLRSRSHRKWDFPKSMIGHFINFFDLDFFLFVCGNSSNFSAKSPVGAMSYEYQLWLTTMTDNFNWQLKTCHLFEWHDQARAPKARDAATWREPKVRWTDDEARKSRGVKREEHLTWMRYLLGRNWGFFWLVIFFKYFSVGSFLEFLL